MNIYIYIWMNICTNYFKMSVGKTHAEFATLLKMLIGYELVMVSYG